MSSDPVDPPPIEPSIRDEATRLSRTSLTVASLDSLDPTNDSRRDGTDSMSLGDSESSEESDLARLFTLTYGELRSLAAFHLRNERRGHTLQPTALVHELFLRLVDSSSVVEKERLRFLAVASRAMRHLLIDHARHHLTSKRGGAFRRVTLSPNAQIESPESWIDLIALDSAMESLSAFHARAARIAEFRLFGGLTVAEVSALLEASERTVAREWSLAKAFLSRQLSDPNGST